MAQTDSQPHHGDYPTNVWSTGEVVPDSYALPLPSTLPAGTYHLSIGMYDSYSLSRLPAFDASGKVLTDDAIPLLEMVVGDK